MVWPSALGRHDFEALATLDPVDGEVAIKGEDAPMPMLFSRRDEGGVSEIHRCVGVLVHQLGASANCRLREVDHDQTPRED